MRGRLSSSIWQSDPALYAPARYRRACRYDAFVPDPIADVSFTFQDATAAVVSDAERALVEINASGNAELQPLARLLLRTESIASSRIEGLAIDARALAAAEARQDAGHRASATAAEILSNIDAMAAAVADASEAGEFTLDDLLAIHTRLMAHSPTPQIGGVVRRVQNWIGGNDYNPCDADFVPPPHDEVPDLLDDLVEAINQDRLPPLVQAAIVHAQFETIHPFADGNGRTGRALIHVVLRRRGLTPFFVPPISVVFAHARERYIDGLGAFREDRVDEWVEQFAVAAARAAALTDRYREGVDSVLDGWRELVADHRSDSAIHTVLQVLPAHPAITLPVAVAATGRDKAAVNRALAALEEAGILDQITGGRRNRVWEAPALLELIDDLDQRP